MQLRSSLHGELGRGRGGQMVSVLASYSDDPCLNPVVVL